MNRKDPFVEGELYHIFNRGVEKRDVFLDDGDFLRFLHSFAEFNTKEPAENIYYKKDTLVSYEVRPRKKRKKKMENYVDLLAFTLLPNHYHFLLRQKVEGGISAFMQKLGTGYTMYFNQRRERVGPLFQGAFKSSHIGSERYALYISQYIHLNVLDAVSPGWKEGNVQFSKELLQKMANYRWSSFGDFIGKARYSSLLSEDVIKEYFPLNEPYVDSIRELLESGVPSNPEEILNSYEVSPRKNESGVPSSHEEALSSYEVSPRKKRGRYHTLLNF